MENLVANYKGYVIIIEKGVEKGIFFRSPLQKVFFDAYYGETKLSAWKYANSIGNPIRKFYEILIGNGRYVKNIKQWLDDIDFAGFHGNIMCFPIYFKREYRKLVAQSCGNDNIQKIESYGYESEFEYCGGCCDIEKTIFHLSNGKSIRIKRRKTFHFTYMHIIEQIINTGIIES